MLRNMWPLSYAGRRSDAAPIGPTATYWRLRFASGPWNANYVSLSEIEMRATEGGADQCSGGTATASTENTGIGATAAKAFDNDNSTVWETTSGNGVNSWIRYQFASAVAVNEISVRNWASWPLEAPKDIVVEYSNDGSSWTEAWTISQCYAWAAGETKVFKKSTTYTESGHRFWRLLFTDGSGGSYCALQEAEFRATTGGADLADGYVEAFASTALTPASNAFNNLGTGGTEWSTTSGNAVNSWLAAQLNAPASITEVQMISCGHSGERPRATSVQWSDDRSTWTTLWSFTAGFTANLETKVFTKP